MDRDVQTVNPMHAQQLQALKWSESEELLELPTTDLTELLLDGGPDDDLNPPTEDIDDFLVHEVRSPEESQRRLRLRRSWIASWPSNTNAWETPTATFLSLPRFPLLPAPKAKASCPLPSFPLLPPEPRKVAPKAPPVRLPRFSLHDGVAAILPSRPPPLPKALSSLRRP